MLLMRSRRLLVIYIYSVPTTESGSRNARTHRALGLNVDQFKTPVKTNCELKRENYTSPPE